MNYSKLHSELQETARSLVGQKSSYWLFPGPQMNQIYAIAALDNSVVASYINPKARIIVDAASIVFDLLKSEQPHDNQ